ELAASTNGNVVAIGTTAVAEHFATGSNSYSALKAAVTNWTLGQAQVFGARGVRCNVVSPGPIFEESGDWGRIKQAMPAFFELAEHETARVTVAADYEDTSRIGAGQFLISYTCDVRPSEGAQRAIRQWVEGGGRWLALHGTNAALDLPRPDGVESPRCFPVWADTLGSQFVAHPPIQPYRV